MTGLLVRAGLGLVLWLGPPSDSPPEPSEPPAAPSPAPAAPSPAPAAPSPAPAAPSPVAPSNDNAPITVTTRLTPETPHIGDLLTLEVIVAYPRDHSVNLPNGLDFGPLELVNVVPGLVESTGNDLRQRFTITLQYFEVGEATVPSFPVTWIDPQDQVHTYAVAPLPFVVESLLANEADPQARGADPMVSLEYPNFRLAGIILAVLGGVLLAVVLALAFILLRRRDRPVYTAPPVPAHERALADLGQLARDREALIAAAAYQDYYLRLTEIAKRYLGARFGFEALDRTTEEIQDLLRRGQVLVEPLDPKAVIGFLQDCDLVKFARLSPPDEETQTALVWVRELVERTRPRPEASADANDDAPPPAKPGAAPIVDPEQPRATRPQTPSPEPRPEPKPEPEREVSP